MKPAILTLLIALLVLPGLTAPASAQVGQGLHGPHYNLNIIGVPKGKTADMTGSHRHTVFVPLDTSGMIDGNVKIYFEAGDEFLVTDGNATDGSATIQVPHGDPGTVCYDVFAVGLGTPGGSAHVDANVLFDETTHDALLALDEVSFNVNRSGKKPSRQNISNVFRVSGCIDLNDSGVCDQGDEFFNNEWVFNVDQLLSYWWDYDNNGLKLMQIRFYECGINDVEAASGSVSIEAAGSSTLSFLPSIQAGTSARLIRYALPASAAVELTVFDVAGRVVARLVEETQAAGEHTVRWEASGLPNGMYFVHLQAGEQSATQKMTVLR